MNSPTMANGLTNMTALNEKLGRDKQYHTITWYFHHTNIIGVNNFKEHR